LKKKTQKSLRRQLLTWLLIPLCSLWAVTTCIAYFLAVGFANDAFDRVLINSADSVASRLQVRKGKVVVDLPPAAQAILRHTEHDHFYYQVVSGDGRERIMGDAVLPKPIPPWVDPLRFRYVTVNGEPLRMARITTRIAGDPDPTRMVYVQVAQTMNSRAMLTRDIFISIVLPQALLILLSAGAVSYGITKGLRPLSDLQAALSTRSRYDLTPVSQETAPVETHQLVDAINDLLARLRNDLESQQRFIANAAHQLRTPLAGLKTYAALAHRAAENANAVKLLDQINTGIDRMSHLVNRLLSLAKADPVNQSARPNDPVDLNSVVSEAAAELVQEALSKNIELEFEGSASATLTGDAAALRELSTNIIENAVRYTQPGGKIVVRVSNGNGVHLAVQDNGPGIPPEDRSLVFERFYRVLGTDTAGSGLGLSIAQEIATAHGAKIEIDSGLGNQGTTVTVHFP
jgi:two-component system sensor histidine kinase TctE